MPPPSTPGNQEPPRPEKPPPNIPIPGEPTVSGKTNQFVCEVCGKVFNSKGELKLHKRTDHVSQKKRK